MRVLRGGWWLVLLMVAAQGCAIVPGRKFNPSAFDFQGVTREVKAPEGVTLRYALVSVGQKPVWLALDDAGPNVYVDQNGDGSFDGKERFACVVGKSDVPLFGDAEIASAWITELRGEKEFDLQVQWNHSEPASKVFLLTYRDQVPRAQVYVGFGSSPEEASETQFEGPVQVSVFSLGPHPAAAEEGDQLVLRLGTRGWGPQVPGKDRESVVVAYREETLPHMHVAGRVVFDPEGAATAVEFKSSGFC